MRCRLGRRVFVSRDERRSIDRPPSLPPTKRRSLKRSLISLAIDTDGNFDLRRLVTARTALIQSRGCYSCVRNFLTVMTTRCTFRGVTSRLGYAHDFYIPSSQRGRSTPASRSTCPIIEENDTRRHVRRRRVKFSRNGSRFTTRVLAQFRDVVESSVDNHGPTIIIM